eukprot:TRINITY_DN32081_c0_g1_i1.p1 TRINITY_DN32081_c0_g1~~TRINITY_DN32081_c0_g1_i1.p1  ORF type:complete len:1772 (-),score=473.05 TRINITY_DN32081_c0_g1_i1:204-5519(-)
MSQNNVTRFVSVLAITWVSCAAARAVDESIFGKVSQMLQEMSTRSSEMLLAAEQELTQLSQACELSDTQTMEQMGIVQTQADEASASIGVLELDIHNLKTNVADAINEIVRHEKAMEELHRVRDKEASTFATNHGEYTAAIAALNRADQILAQHEASATATAATSGDAVAGLQLDASTNALRGARNVKHFTQAGAEAAILGRSAVERLRQAGLYQPDDGGILKDEHLFDEFEGLHSSNTAYTHSGDDSVRTMLTNLKTTFQQAASELFAAEQLALQTFQDEYDRLAQTIHYQRGQQQASTEQLTFKQASLAEQQSALQDALSVKEGLESFHKTTSDTCDQKEEAYTKIIAMRKEEVEALNRAIAMLSGAVAASATKHFPSLVRLRSASTAALKPAVAAQDAKRIIGFLTGEAKKMKSASLGQFATQLGAFAVAGQLASADPLEKVKGMIYDLILKLQRQASEEATNKAWCDTQLAENEAIRKGAQEEIHVHATRITQQTGRINELALQLADLNESLQEDAATRAKIVEQRANESVTNLATIQDAEDSSMAIGAAMALLEDYIANATKTQTAVANLTQGATSALQMSKTEGFFAAAPLAGKIHKAIGMLKVPETPEQIMKGLTATTPLSLESRNVIEMLEIVQNNFDVLAKETQALEAKQAALAQNMLDEIDVMVAKKTTDRSHTEKEKASLLEAQANIEEDMNASTKTLSDAEATYENLKEPCLNRETFEERKMKREKEVAALEESLRMLDEFAAAIPGSTDLTGSSALLLQQHFGELRVQEESVSLTNDIGNSTETIQRVVNLMMEIRNEVAADLAHDTSIHITTSTWCGDAITAKSAAIGDARDREQQLVTEIETSAQAKASLTAEIEHLGQEMARDQNSLTQNENLWERANATFHESEIELNECVMTLRQALIVLESRYNGSNSEASSRDFAAEREQLENDKNAINGLSSSLGFVAVVAQVEHALKALPGSEDAGLNALSASDAAELQAFFARPADFLSSHSSVVGIRNRRAALVARHSAASGASSDSDGGGVAVDGLAIFGILRQLEEQFSNDLEALRRKHVSDAEDFRGLAETKKDQMEAKVTTLAAKQEQLVHYTSVNAEAKVDLEYNRAAREADTIYLTDVQEMCRTQENEFAVRDAARKKELAAIDEAVTVLQSGLTTVPEDSAPLADGKKQPATPEGGFLLHSAKANTAGGAAGGRVFLRSQRVAAKKKTKGAPNMTASAAGATTSAGQHKTALDPVAIVEAYMRKARSSPRHSIASGTVAAAPAKLASHARLEKLAKAATALRALRPVGKHADHASLPKESAGLRDAESVVAGLEKQMQGPAKALATIAMHSRVGPLTSQELRVITGHIDAMKAELVAEKQLEIRMHDACVTEGNAANQQLERRYSDQKRHISIINVLNGSISRATEQVADIRQQIIAMNESLASAQAERVVDHEANAQTVQTQLHHQALLHQAIQAISSLYDKPVVGSDVVSASLVASHRPSGRVSVANNSRTKVIVAGHASSLSNKKEHVGASKKTSPMAFIARSMQRRNALQDHVAIIGGVVNHRDIRRRNTSLTNASGDADVEELQPRQRNRVNSSAYAMSVPTPVGFSKPFTTHQSGRGVLGLLRLLVEQSEELVESIVRAEENAADSVLSEIKDTERAMDKKDRLVVDLERALGDDGSAMLDEEESLQRCNDEIAEIQSFINIVDEKCSHVQQHFTNNQKARDAELESLETAKSTLLGMIQDPVALFENSAVQSVEVAAGVAARHLGFSAAGRGW